MSRKGLESNVLEDTNAGAGLPSAAHFEPWQGGDPIQRTPAARRFLRVLVADDNRDTTDTLSMLVQRWGHDVRRAYDGASALEMTADYPADVLVLDIQMPKMNGCHLAQQLRRQLRFKDTLLIAMTGKAGEVHRRVCEEAGFNLILIKPMEPSNLETLLLLECERLAKMPEARCPRPRKFGILIVDEEAYMRNGLRVWLRQHGFAVWLAADDREALELYRRHQEVIDLVLVDVGMAGLDGPKTLAEFREINPRIHRILIERD